MEKIYEVHIMYETAAHHTLILEVTNNKMKKDTVILTTIGKFKHKVSSVLNGSSEYSGKVRFAFLK